MANCAREAVDAGYTAFKTNIVFPGENPSVINNMFAGSNDQKHSDRPGPPHRRADRRDA